MAILFQIRVTDTGWPVAPSVGDTSDGVFGGGLTTRIVVEESLPAAFDTMILYPPVSAIVQVLEYELDVAFLIDWPLKYH